MAPWRPFLLMIRDVCVYHTLECVPMQQLALGVLRKLVLFLELYDLTASKCASLCDADLDLQLDKSRAKY